LGEVSRHLKANLVTRHQQGMNATSKTNDIPLLRGGSFPADAGVSLQERRRPQAGDPPRMGEDEDGGLANGEPGSVEGVSAEELGCCG